MDAKVVTAPTEGPIHGDGEPYNGLITLYHPTEGDIGYVLYGTSFDGECRQTARLFAASYTSYQRHCTDPVSAAEGDLLGRCVDLLAIIDDALSGVICPGSNDCISYLGDDARTSLELALPDVRSILSQVREVRS